MFLVVAKFAMTHLNEPLQKKQQLKIIKNKND